MARFLLNAAAFFATHGIRVQRVMTDRSLTYVHSRDVKGMLHHLEARHKLTRPYRPQTNGKAERFIQSLLREWAYARLYRSDKERHAALAKWLHYYNHHRPHTALGGRVPASQSVNNVCGNHSQASRDARFLGASHPNMVFLSAPAGVRVDRMHGSDLGASQYRKIRVANG